MPAAPYHTYATAHKTVYTTNLNQANGPKLAMSCVVAKTPAAGKYGTKGVQNPFLGVLYRGRELKDTVAAAMAPKSRPLTT
jgi:hypothetical protein|tara:strand:- start:365 stop:607 length:243 start_codon:yes stop_codon:yes gene_type:complete